MSYITRTSNIVMVDQTCVTEALQRIQATNIRHMSNQLMFTYQGDSLTFTRLHNGTYSWRGGGQQGARVDNAFRALEKAYRDIQNERKEAERRERERIATLQKRLVELNAKTSFGEVKHQAIEIDKSEVEQQLAASEATLAMLEKKQNEFEQSRQHYLTTTKEQVKAVGQKGNWGLTNLTEDTSGRKTHIQFRRKVSN